MRPDYYGTQIINNIFFVSFTFLELPDYSFPPNKKTKTVATAEIVLV